MSCVSGSVKPLVKTSNPSHNSLELNPVTGIIDGVEYIASPNYDSRPPGTSIDLLVIHSISLPPGEYGGSAITELFTNLLNPASHPYFSSISTLKVSAHFFIRRTGELIQFVPTIQRAWHAGASSYNGRERCNDFSIGIELEGTDDTPFETAQYQTLITLSKLIMYHYPAIDLTRIVGHSDIAPGRKTDPGNCFDWTSFRKKLME